MIKESVYGENLVFDTMPGRNGDSERLSDLAKDTQEVAGLGFELW